MSRNTHAHELTMNTSLYIMYNVTPTYYRKIQIPVSKFSQSLSATAVECTITDTEPVTQSH